MSRIFSIFGNFVQFGRWSTPDPSFTGKIVVDDNDEFFGICEELYNSKMSSINRTRYLVGAFAANGRNEKKGIAFYKLSNDYEQSPLMYVLPDIADSENGSWTALTFLGYFQEQGKAKIILKEEAYSEDEKNRIKTQFDNLNKRVNGNDQLLEQVSCCKDIITNAK